MNLLLDMHLSVEIAQQLRADGHDAFQLRERGLQRLADEKIVELAAAEKRVLVSFDLDFSDILSRTVLLSHRSSSLELTMHVQRPWRQCCAPSCRFIPANWNRAAF